MKHTNETLGPWIREFMTNNLPNIHLEYAVNTEY